MTVSKEWGQLGDIARLFVQLMPNFKWIALVSLAVALIAGAYVALTHEPTYLSEAIAIVRPQQLLVARAKKDETQPIEEKAKSLLPQPLDVTDYVLFLQSEGMLSSVAQAYNTYHASDSEPLLTVAQLRRMLTPNARLEIKTPYAVEYYPTIELRVAAQSPDKAYNLA
ncbi:MAG TPA: Wzz/FepE/Etk N-terminal domain-containing protein, partial [Candidatus Hydrogenedentes bacterium]|nr:Wzz/FepE/Etk N-terminal domain-containing protein [Candidatus Hydrogenedentota bacterium]